MSKSAKFYLAKQIEKEEPHRFQWRAPAEVYDRLEKIQSRTEIPMNQILSAAAEMFADSFENGKIKTREDR